MIRRAPRRARAWHYGDVAEARAGQPRVARDVVSRTALVLLVAYLVITCGWRPFLQWRRTGDAGIRISRHTGAAEKTTRALMVSGSVVGLRGVARVARGRSAPYPLTLVVRGLGLGILGAAAAITTRAQLDLGRSWRVGVDEAERTELVTNGTFSVVRNPIFSGVVLAVVGLGLSVPSPATWSAMLALLAGLELQVRAVEEPYLLRTHGDAYRAYARRTGRFAPGLGRLG